MEDNTLNNLYKEISEIDKEIINLLNARFDLVYEANQYKEKNDLPIKDLEHEWEVEENLEPLSNYTNMVKDIWEVIFKYGRTLK